MPDDGGGSRQARLSRLFEDREDGSQPTVRRDGSVNRRHLIETAIFGIPFLACLLVAIFHREDLFLHCIIIAVPILVIGFIRQCRRFRRFECPKCGARVSRKDGKPSEPVVFHCERCDTAWDTGFTESATD